MLSTGNKQSYDTRLYNICEPWHGERGLLFSEKFIVNFKAGLMEKSDDYCTYEQHLSGHCPGGIVKPSAAQLLADAAHVNVPRPHQGNASEVRKSEAAFNNRDAAIVQLFRKHITADLVQARIDDIRQMHEDGNYDGGAPVLDVVVVAGAPPNYAAAHPRAGQPLNADDLAAYQSCGNSLARHIIRIISTEAVPDPSSGLTRMNLDNRWSNAKMQVVGITETTPRDLAAWLTRLATESGRSEQAKTVKFLSLLTQPADVATKATQELQRCSEHLRNPDGSPCFRLVVQEMQELWSVCAQRNQIAFKPKMTATGVSNTVDGFSATFEEDEGSEADEFAYMTSGRAAATGAAGSISDEALCWNCLGWGHTKNGNPPCPSARRFRKMSEAAAALNSRAAQMNRGGRGGRSNSGRFRPRGGRSNSLPPPGSRREPPVVNSLDDSHLSDARIDGDGNVYSIAGDIIGQIGSKSAAEEKEKITPTANDDKTAEEFEKVDPERFDMGEFGSTHLGGNIYGLEVVVDDRAEATADESEVVVDDRTEATSNDISKPGKSNPFSCLTSILVSIGAVAKGVFTAVNANRRAVAATTAACMVTGVSSLSIGNVYPATLTPATHDSGVTWDANIDSGASISASGRSNLFPPKLITKWHPKFSVRSASRQVMPVLFIGSMLLKPAGINNKKNKGLIVENALYVPDMKELTLISPKQLFRSHGIRTYFNDENYLKLPDGATVEFTETSKSYILKIEPLDDELRKFDASNASEFASAECLERCLALAPAELTAELVHRRCCHFSPDRISDSLPYVKGICKVPRFHCHDCLRGGMKAPSVQPQRKQSDNAKPIKPKSEEFGDLIWSDTCSLPVSEPYGYVGWVAFLDDATRWLALYFIRNHTAEEILSCLQTFLTDNCEYLPKVDGRPHCKCFGTDNHGEYFSESSEKFMQELFIRHVSQPGYNPWRNPSERSHGIVLRCIRIVHAESGAPLQYWPFTAATAVFVHNGLVTRSAHVIHPASSPHFMKTGVHANFTRLRCLYCRIVCFVRGEKESLTKIDVPTVEGIYLGIDHRRQGYFAYVLTWKRFSTFAFNDCRFYENDYPSFTGEFGKHTDSDDVINPRRLEGPPLTDRAGNRTRGTRRRPARPASAARAAAAPAAAPPVAVANQPPAPTVGMRVSGYFPPGNGVPGSWDPGTITRVHSTGAFDVVYDDGLQENTQTWGEALRPLNTAVTTDTLINGTDALFVSFNDNYSPIVLDSIGPDAYLCLNLDAVGALPSPPRKSSEFDSRPDGDEWWAGAKREFLLKKANDTFDLVDRPTDGTNVVKSRIVCSYKYDPITGALRDENGHYVRWVACGYSEIFGRDYWETYTATTKSCGLRVFAALVASYDLDTCHIDDVKFFTQTPLKQKIYCEQMDGFEEGGLLPDGRRKLVCLLKKGLEGLKQSGNNAQTQCTEHLIGPCQLTQLESEPTIFHRTFTINGVRVFFILLVWIDDKWAGFSRGGYESILVPFLKNYNLRFKSTNSVGDVSRFVGIDITRDRSERTISLSQEKYIHAMVPKFVDDVKLKTKKSALPATTAKPDPYHSLYDLSLKKTEADRIDKPYLAAIASAMYAACITRGDVAFYTSFLSQFSKLPFSEAWDALEQLLISLYASRKLSLTYGGKKIKIPDAPTCSPPLNPSVIEKVYGLMIYSDGSWKLGCTYAGFFILFCNAAIDWGAVKLKVMLSSTEAEIASGSLATRRIVYVRHLLGEILKLPQLPVTHIVDNSATPCLTEKMGASKKTEHFRRWEQFMRYAVVHGHSYVHLCATRDQLADGLTKVTNGAQYIAMRNTMLNL